MPIHVEIITQDGKLFEELEADMVIVPGSEGEMGVLPHHSPVLTTLGFGELRVKKGNAEEDFVVYGGVVDIRPGHVIALADTAASSYSLDVAEAEKARARAQELMAHGVPQEEERVIADDLRRAELTVRVAAKQRARTGFRIRVVDDDSVNAPGNPKPPASER